MQSAADPMTPVVDDRDAHRLTSRWLHRLGDASASTVAPALAAFASLAFLVVALLAPRANPWLTAYGAVSAAITLVMVFALQHTQTLQQAAVQRKLDEILRVLPGADSRLMHVETASVSELDALGERHNQVREDALKSSYQGPS